MKRIAYTRADGGLSLVSLAEGARLARWIVLQDGDRVTNAVPVRGAILDQNGGVLSPVEWEFIPTRADQLLRRWPVAGAIVEWAETEAEFVARLIASVVPKDALDVEVVDEVPDDRTYRNAWKRDGGKVDVDLVAAKAIDREKLMALPIAEDELRKAIAAIDAAKTPAELKTRTDEVLINRGGHGRITTNTL